jgi:adenosylcobinamide-GDP ribazoletransferase
LRAALSYFTILPAGVAEAPDPAALAWLPFAGALTGALAGLAAEGIARVANHALAVACAFALSVVLTGAIHVDGFLDGCDAFFASVPPERRLEILKDPHHGTFAIAGFGVVLAMWLAALWSLTPATYPAALALSAASSRWAAVIHACYVPYGRAGPATRAFESRPPPVVLGLGLALVAALAWPFGMRGGAALAATLGLSALCAGWIRSRLGGGLVGDAYGFIIVVAEVGALLVLAS